MAPALARLLGLLGSCAVVGEAAAVVYLTTSGTPSSGVVPKNITVPFVANATLAGAMSGWTVVQAAQYTRPVNITLVYEWLPAPFNCPFVSAIDNIWCTEALCWQLSINSLVVINDLINATLIPGDTMQWQLVEMGGRPPVGAK